MRNSSSRALLGALVLGVTTVMMVPGIAPAQVASPSTVFPALRAVGSGPLLPGEETHVTGTGGYSILPDGSADRSAREFMLFFDRTDAGYLLCENDRCEGELVVPAGAAPGEHRVSTEGGSTLVVTVEAAPPPLPAVQRPPAVASRPLGELAPAGNGKPRVAGPPAIANHPEKIIETDVVYLSGAVDGGPFTFVSAAGSGKEYKLTRWSLGGTPEALYDSEAVSGFDVKLQNPRILGGILVSSARTADGNLWLTSWRVQGGAFVKVQTRGYGANAQVKVRGYDLGGRRLSPDLAEIVTPVADQHGRPRLVTWQVDSNGTIAAKEGTDPVPGGLDIGQSAPTVMHQTGLNYVVNFKTSIGRMAWQYWSVNAGGAALLGETDDQLTLRGAPATLASTGPGVDALPLTAAGQVVVTASPGIEPTLRLTSMEHRQIGGLYGEPYRISANTSDQAPDTPGVLITPPTVNAANYVVTDGLRESQLGAGQGSLLGDLAFDPPATGIGSVAKVMSLDRVIGALNQGKVFLDDKVTITDEMLGGAGLSYAFTSDRRLLKVVNGSPQPVAEGDVVTLRTLLLGSIMLSDRMSTLAAAYHAAQALATDETLSFGELVGTSSSAGQWIDAMNARATALGMQDSKYCGTAGAALSTPQDQTTLWRIASNDASFRDITSKLVFTPGDAAAEQAVTGLMLQPFGKLGSSADTYPGFLGSKGGNAGSTFGVGYVGEELECYQPDPDSARACGACLSTHHQRLDRPLFTAQTQATGRGENAMRLLDYGYQAIFTPDMLSNSGDQGPKVGDFGIASLSPGLGVSAAVVGGGTLEVCGWSATESATQKLGCRQRAYQGLTPSSGGPAGQLSAGAAPVPKPTVIDIEDVTSVGADLDLLVAWAPLGELQVSLWRVGPRP